MDVNPRYVIAIAEHGSINKAAQASGISQSALSQRLKNLEVELGCTLFDRSTTPLRPTDAGKAYLTYARRAVDDERHMEREIYALAQRRIRHLRLAVSAPRSASLLPDVLARFRREDPSCIPTFVTAGTPELVQGLLLSGEVDAALLTPVKPDEVLFTSIPLCRERQVLVAPRGYPVPHEMVDGLPLASVEGMPFIMPTTRSYFDSMLRMVADALGVHLDVVIHCCEIEMALALVRRGVGVSIVTDTDVPCDEAGEIDVYCLDDMRGGRDLYLVTLAREEPGDDLRLLVRLVREWLAAQPAYALEPDGRA